MNTAISPSPSYVPPPADARFVERVDEGSGSVIPLPDVAKAIPGSKRDG
jgi:hypothetical protein